MTTITPPLLARAVLRAILPGRDSGPITGDLLEEYRESIEAGRGKTAADLWYVQQVISLALRVHIYWAVIFVAIFAGRSAFDTFVPTHDFLVRSAITTYGAMAIWVAAGFNWTWRTRLLRSAAFGGVVSAALACLLNLAIVSTLIGTILATNNQLAWAGIQSSGGTGEMFLMPAIVLIPATLFATLGGTAALMVRGVRG